MEPDVMRLYSSSPPPLDEGAEDEDDEFGEFGEFGGFGGAMASSFSFSDMDVPPAAFNQPQASDTAPPELPIGSSAPGPQKASVVGRAGSCDHPPQHPQDEAQVEPEQGSTECEVGGGTTETRSPHGNGGVRVPETFVNGFPETDTQDASVDPPTTSALSSSSSSPCAQRRSREETDHNDTSQHNVTSGEGPSLANGFTDFHSHMKEEADGDEEEQEVLSEEEDAEPRHKETSVQPQSLSGSGLNTEASVPPGDAQRPLGPCSTGQEGGVSPEDQGSGCHDVRPAEEEEEEKEVAEEEDLPTPSGPMSESDDFASFCEVVSPSDEFGDFGHFSSTVAPPPSSVALSGGPTMEPPDDSDGDDDDFGGFGEAGALSTQGFADFSQTESCTQEGGFAHFPSDGPTAPSEAASEASPARAEEANVDQTLPAESPAESGVEEADEGSCTQEEEGEEEHFGDLPVSDSFADFQSVPVGGGVDDGEDWAAFGEAEGVGEQAGDGGDNWAAFGKEQPQVRSEQAVEEEEEQEEEEEPQWQDGATATPPTYGSPHTSRRDSLTAPLSSRLQRLFQASFPHVEAHQVGEEDEVEIPALKALLEPQQPADPGDEQSNQPPSPARREPQDMWRHLQDIHGAFGLKFLWGGSHSNRQLLRCLAVDTRNIVFAGQKKQPVIVPAYAAGLGMLEPTKDPVNATSAAGPVAASAQVPPGSPSKPTKEALSSVQPDWSSSGLKPPVDDTESTKPPPSPPPPPVSVSVSALELNLDFFGPVEEEDSSSGSSTPPAGVDPELYELTTVPMEPSNTGKHIADAFTRLMSTMEQNSTSTRRPIKEESVSEEAARVLSVLPDLTFMRAKVLMFPSILTPRQPPDASS